MKRWKRIALYLAIILFLLVATGVGLISYYFGVEVTTEGGSQGFSIGESKTSAYAKANDLLRNGKITAMHVEADIRSDNHWVLIVNPEWWNNKITLVFEEGNIIEIRRDRICCELP